MQLLYVVESLSKNGGAENALVNLAVEMRKLGHKIIIIHLWGPNDFEEELKINDVVTHSLKIKSRWNVLQGTSRLNKIIISDDIKIINAINFFPMLYVALSKLFIRGKKRIVTYHNMGYEVYPAKSPLKILRKFLDILLNNYFIDGYIGVSDAVSNSYAKHLHISSFNTIGNIISIDSINEAAYKGPLPSRINNNFRIVMAGRFVPEKGYQYMVQAMEILMLEGAKFQLSIFGDGNLKSEINAEIKNRKLSEYISIMPSINKSKLYKVIQESDVLVMSSVSEGLPMIIAESMVLGTPVVATSVGGIPDLIEDGISGILVPSRNAKLLAEKIKNLLKSDVLRKELSDNGKIRIMDKLNPVITCQNLINYYSEILLDRKIK